MPTNILLSIPLKYWQDFQDSLAKISNTNIYVFDASGKPFSAFSQDVATCQSVNKGRAIQDAECMRFYQEAFTTVQQGREGKIFTCPYGCKLHICALGSHSQKIGYLAVHLPTPEAISDAGNQRYYLIQRVCQIVNETLKAVIEKTVLGLQRLELSSIYEISNLLISTVELSKVAEFITNSLVILYNIDVVALGLHENGRIKVIQATGEYRDSLVGQEWSLETPPLSEAFLRGEPLSIEARDLKLPNGVNPLGKISTNRAIIYPLYSFPGIVGLLLITYSPQETTIDPGSRNLQIYANFAAIALANARLVSQLEREAQTDFLTGLYSKRILLSILSHELEKSRRYDTPLSVLFIDIDDFKAYNDAYGHVAGDIALKKLAEILKTSTRRADFVGRYGGEEFVAILPGATKKDAIAVAEKIRKAVEHATFPFRKMTVSVGVATATVSDSTDSLINRADRCLYQAKREGKNRTCADFPE